jgi:ketosteroid isomerase-like protein
MSAIYKIVFSLISVSFGGGRAAWLCIASSASGFSSAAKFDDCAVWRENLRAWTSSTQRRLQTFSLDYFKGFLQDRFPRLMRQKPQHFQDELLGHSQPVCGQRSVHTLFESEQHEAKTVGLDRNACSRFREPMRLAHLTKGASLLFLAFSLGTVVAQKPRDASNNAGDQVELQRLEKVWNEAHLRGDTAALDDLWADELVVTVPRMQVMNEAQSLAIWRTGRMKFQHYETSDISFRIFGDAVVVTGRLLRERTFGDKNIHEDWRFTKVYVRRQGKWRVVSWQASESAPG